MTATINVEKLSPGEFRVRVSEGRSESSHTVTLPPQDHPGWRAARPSPKNWCGARSSSCSSASPGCGLYLQPAPDKESILSRFELPVIVRYFPENEREIKRRL
jgi:hypothetical protein